ncbi:MAG: hypothetical protein JXR48_08905 [Candidatus Delongbacteria bacterium]|nr:hypothetical protein [Candidatus Delongbacteria bacterium]MBN2835071.1 hypothetical protein [Candidatus Delongbacteria bacterium]
MKLIIDGKSKEINTSSFSVFKEFFDKLSKGLTAEERVISKIKINDELMKDGSQFDKFELPMDQFHTVEIFTIEKNELINQNIDGLCDHIDNLIKNIDISADSFRMGEETNSNQYFAAVLEGIRWFNYSLNLLISFKKIDPDNFILADQTISEEIKNMERTLDTLADAQEEKDYLALADQLEYELKPLLSKWRNNLNVFSR